MKQKRSDEMKALEYLVCRIRGHVPAPKTSKHWGVNYCSKCKAPLYATTESSGPK